VVLLSVEQGKPGMAAPRKNPNGATGEAELVRRATRGDETAIRAIIAHNNSRLFRLARCALRSDWEAEDALQNAYCKAFAALGGFRGDSALSTWLSRIVLNECLQQLRRKQNLARATARLQKLTEAQIIPFPHAAAPQIDPEKTMAQRELLRLVEAAIDQLPDAYRIVLVARTLEGMTVEETAELLSLRPETVKTRLFRARQALKAALASHLDPLVTSSFPFLGRRCENMADVVVARLRGNSEK
jgi:RNA polymerase sigma-70 factor, ECF subfamily